jgi:subtilisin-like proprotein convertase family protein
VVELTVCNTTPVAIPDNNSTGITSNLAVGTVGTVSNALCSVNITHTWKGDLTIDLVSPNATTVRLHNRTGSSTDNVITSYDNVTAPDGPGVMNNFDGGAASGTWQLKVADRASADVGTLNNWCVTLTVTQEGSVPTVAGALRAEAADGGVLLSWNTYSIDGVAGFNVLRRVGDSGFTAVNGEPVAAAKGTTSYFDAAAGLQPGTTLTYRLAVVHTGNAVDVLPDDVQVQLSSRVPTKFALEQNQPNPFNPKTTIRFALTAADHTSLRIYDPAGRLVHTLVNQQLEPGVHEVTWDGTDARGQRVATGTYFYQVRSGRFEQTKSMVLVK